MFCTVSVISVFQHTRFVFSSCFIFFLLHISFLWQLIIVEQISLGLSSATNLRKGKSTKQVSSSTHSWLPKAKIWIAKIVQPPLVFENIRRISKQLSNDTLSLHYLWCGVQDNLGWILQFSFGTCQTSKISLGTEWSLNIILIHRSTAKTKKRSLFINKDLSFTLIPRVAEVARGTGGTRRKIWTRTKILSPNIRYFVVN